MSSMSFSQIPAGLRVPFFYIELDSSKANSFSQTMRVLLIGLMAADATAEANVPVICPSAEQARSLFGSGSMAAAMVEAFRAGNLFTELWVAPVAEPAAGVAAVRTITFTGAATASTVAALYVGAARVAITIRAADTAADVATAFAAAVNAAPSLPVTATALDGALTLTSRFKGEAGNGVPLALNRRGLAGGESFPAGISAGAVTVGTAGAGAPDLSGVIANLGDEEYDFIGCAFSDAVSLDALRAEMDDTTGRWSWARQVYGHVYSARRGTLAELQAYGATRNDQHCTLFGVEPRVGACDHEYIAARVAREASLLSAHVARPTQTGEISGVLAPASHERLTLTERQTLLSSGIATHYSGKDGVVRIERSITTYQKNPWGSNDTSYLDSENLHQLAYVMRYLRTGVTTQFGRHALRSDGIRVPEGVATPSMIKARLVADYAAMERAGIVERSDLFAENLIVEIDETNPNRVNVLYPPDLVNQLRIFAVLNQFRLNY